MSGTSLETIWRDSENLSIVPHPFSKESRNVAKTGVVRSISSNPSTQSSCIETIIVMSATRFWPVGGDGDVSEDW